MAKYTRQEIADAIAELRELLPRPASERDAHEIGCILRHVSSSGMSRTISFYLLGENMRMIDYLVSKACAYRDRSTPYPFDRKRDGLKVSGCGMDMGFSVVYNLSSTLYSPSEGRTGREGYLLRARWL